MYCGGCTRSIDERVAGGHHPIAEQKQQRVRPLEVLEHVDQVIVLLDVARLGQKVNDHFGVAGCVEDGPVLLVLLAQ